MYSHLHGKGAKVKREDQYLLIAHLWLMTALITGKDAICVFFVFLMIFFYLLSKFMKS